MIMIRDVYHEQITSPKLFGLLGSYQDTHTLLMLLIFYLFLVKPVPASAFFECTGALVMDSGSGTGVDQNRKLSNEDCILLM